MTDNQFREMMDKLTELEDEIQKMIEEQHNPKAGKIRLKPFEKSLETTNRALDTLAGESIRVKSRVEILEERIN